MDNDKYRKDISIDLRELRGKLREYRECGKGCMLWWYPYSDFSCKICY